jgi:hypothetical protein
MKKKGNSSEMRQRAPLYSEEASKYLSISNPLSKTNSSQKPVDKKNFRKQDKIIKIGNTSET